LLVVSLASSKKLKQLFFDGYKNFKLFILVLSGNKNQKFYLIFIASSHTNYSAGA
jgi:hypothetical protein